jgi:antitoxin PrlF
MTEFFTTAGGAGDAKTVVQRAFPGREPGKPSCIDCGKPYDYSESKEPGMAESTLTAKGRTTVPAAIRAQLNAVPGTRLMWSVTPNGTIIVRARNKSILDMAGMLKAPEGKRVAVEDMNPWR